MKKIIKNAAAKAGKYTAGIGLALVAAVALVFLYPAAKTSAGGNYYSSGQPPTTIASSQTNVGGTNYYVSWLLNTNSPQYGASLATNIPMPGTLAASTTTNLGYRWDISSYQNVGLQFTGVQFTTNTNQVTMNWGVNEDASTNIAPLLAWTVGVTNAAALTNSTWATNLSVNENHVSGHKYLYLISIATGAGSFTGSQLTNFAVSVNLK